MNDINVEDIKENIQKARQVLESIGPELDESEKTALRTALLLHGLLRRSGEASASLSPVQRQKKKLSIVEFLREKQPASFAEQAQAIGYYKEQYTEVSTFMVADLKKWFSEAKLPKPTNMNDIINLNIRNGFMMEAEEKKKGRKAFTMTQKG